MELYTLVQIVTKWKFDLLGFNVQAVESLFCYGEISEFCDSYRNQAQLVWKTARPLSKMLKLEIPSFFLFAGGSPLRGAFVR